MLSECGVLTLAGCCCFRVEWGLGLAPELVLVVFVGSSGAASSSGCVRAIPSDSAVVRTDASAALSAVSPVTSFGTVSNLVEAAQILLIFAVDQGRQELTPHVLLFRQL